MAGTGAPDGASGSQRSQRLVDPPLAGLRRPGRLDRQVQRVAYRLA